jgi:hypothetical protein
MVNKLNVLKYKAEKAVSIEDKVTYTAVAISGLTMLLVLIMVA